MNIKAIYLEAFVNRFKWSKNNLGQLLFWQKCHRKDKCFIEDDAAECRTSGGKLSPLQRWH